MRLKYIKLAGFKSFVDPTKVPFEQQMTAIVGPNGCGKSNIIDAVRWVLGESSAKHLRGDAMTDVIFNGAASRKPVGQASVELMFDNMSGRLQGSLANRNEISVRRLVNRDGQNSYYLNGSKCRRRDITDIFLGTGLGPRSYGIIEQGTISRLIESKPQELRVFIEEAAGISKYKERRRDTENRIRHTKENLSRLTDIRLELGQHIEKLDGQAQAAKRYKTLKKQERQYKAELAVLRWQKHSNKVAEIQQQITALKEQLSNANLTRDADQTSIKIAKQQQDSIRQSIEKYQQEKVQLTNNIARLEQQLQFVKQQKSKLEQDKITCAEQIANAQQFLLSEQQAQVEIKQELQMLSPKVAKGEQEIAALSARLNENEQHRSQAQQKWQLVHLQQEQLKTRYQAHNEKVSTVKAQIAATEQRIKEKQVTLNQLTEKLATYQEPTAVKQLKAQFQQAEQQLAQSANLLDEKTQQLAQCQSNNTQITTQLQALTSRLAVVEQQLDQKQDWQIYQQQIIEHGNQTALQQLHEQLAVEQGWELAVEMVLADLLSAQVIPNLPEADLVATLNNMAFALVDKSTHKQPSVGTLAAKASHPDVQLPFLNHIVIADTPEQCYQLLPQLTSEQSVICPQGVWLSAQFARKGLLEKQDHKLALDTEKHQLLVDVAHLQEKHKVAQSELFQIQQSNDELKSQHNQLQANFNQLMQRLQQAQSEQQFAEQSKAQDLLAKENILQEIEQLTTQVAKWQHELAELHQQTIVESTDSDTNAIYQEVERFQQKASELSLQLHVIKEQHHHDIIQLERVKHQHGQLQQNIERYQTTIEQLSRQQAQYQSQLEQQGKPVADDEEQLQHWLARMADVDQSLVNSQTQISQHADMISKLENNQQNAQKSTSELQANISQLQIDAEANKVKANSALEPLHEIGQHITDIEKHMPVDAKEGVWQAHVIRLQQDIAQLGAINLAAIDEFDSQLSRKNFLDQQDQDLNQAISTLESAIAKIDKESRQKFKVTFDKVNQDLQTLFPKVFGGGQAYLALTDDDLLETGVSIMAQPPGKKNSTIHLLSGGEKALTALSLVFAIFRLNPAPFCMLDEVDAPLDDANVNRFCNLVREMSDSVQFIYISHNKIAMEMASHLTGVTMFEPGVSRMVSVDIDEAIAMAEVS
ncbi:chromosome segregation protein SMC [Thalassotalea marina]|uniref:Chromosome partition protein Smc n=1 Tax=Thalassotalea marina TaxID=1673741 RepID=A0A919BQD6_9GAMM|nr:chromosome segregation protein SMC [Thalassotalea marina]GHG06166.1 chromosome partition protein Smc [Thalassotalea marina]